MERVLEDISKYNVLKLAATVEYYEWEKIESRFYRFLKEIDIKDN